MPRIKFVSLVFFSKMLPICYIFFRNFFSIFSLFFILFLHNFSKNSPIFT